MDALSPEPIMRLAAGFMAAKHLFTANELGLFEALADDPATLDALAARTGLTPRTARISADAMVALGLIERDGDAYRNSALAATFLSGTGPADMRPFLRFWDHISYPSWIGLADALGKGQVNEIVGMDAETQRIASAGIEAVLAGPAAALANTVKFTDRQRLLDVGGGTGSWSIAVVRQHPHMTATVVDLPKVADIARGRIADAGLTSRIDVVSGDAFDAALPAGHDVCLVANLIHYFSPEENQQLLRRIRGAVETGARLLLADFWTDSTHTEPLMAALMAGEFAVHVRHGDVYSVSEAQQWLEGTGWQLGEHLPLAGPVSLITAQAR
jgi:ubiquinone/menaquinone biosynthesis C-methylase UbiE